MKLWKWFQRVALGRDDILDDDGTVYKERWLLVHNKWFGIRLHHIMRSDADIELHDHQYSYVSIILWGGYREFVPPDTLPHRPEHGTANRWYGPGSVLFRSAEDAHRIGLNSPAWTLMIRGPKRRAWGFHTARGWMPWREFMVYRARWEK